MEKDLAKHARFIDTYWPLITAFIVLAWFYLSGSERPHNLGAAAIGAVMSLVALFLYTDTIHGLRSRTVEYAYVVERGTIVLTVAVILFDAVASISTSPVLGIAFVMFELILLLYVAKDISSKQYGVDKRTVAWFYRKMLLPVGLSAAWYIDVNIGQPRIALCVLALFLSVQFVWTFKRWPTVPQSEAD